MALDQDFFRPWIHKKWCWDNGYFVEIKPIKKKGKFTHCRLHLKIQKNIQKGTEEYNQNSLQLNNKIDELYAYMYNTFK